MPDLNLDDAAERRMGIFFDRIGGVLHNKRRRASFAMYALGLLGDGDRKSVEPIAARACGDPALCEAYHARLLHFLTDSVWDDHGVRRAATEYAICALAERGEPITSWIIDDAGFLKQGTHSVGVQRQYTGSAGKIANCQVGVSLSVATRTEHLPLDFELYLPKSWTEDPKRRREAKIPDAVSFKTKIDLALQMIERAARNKVPGSIILADSAYGDSSEFRGTVRLLGLDYGVGIHGPTKLWRVDKRLRRIGPAISAVDLALAIGVTGFRRCTWREGTKERLSSRFALRRVVSAHDDGIDPAQREDVWLLMEWSYGEPKPTKFFMVTLPRSSTRKQIVRIVKERYRTERLYQDLKGELGLDHFEGRSFPGWHHHIEADAILIMPPAA